MTSQGLARTLRGALVPSQAHMGVPGGVGVDAGDSNGSIRAASVNGNGGSGIVLAESANPVWIAIDADCVYWTDTKTNNLSVVAKP
jgi:hypothetical protein